MTQSPEIDDTSIAADDPLTELSSTDANDESCNAKEEEEEEEEEEEVEEKEIFELVQTMGASTTDKKKRSTKNGCTTTTTTNPNSREADGRMPNGVEERDAYRRTAADAERSIRLPSTKEDDCNFHAAALNSLRLIPFIISLLLNDKSSKREVKSLLFACNDKQKAKSKKNGTKTFHRL
ncbi:hypothetical protein OUZ56_031334 [Daphnia magna]|uniref:Uncharacterized protein n=1 Tax=Daphnia magna TaxID=35525 RepID=A0ABQ9ZTX8_9CRUS|nr:hypothetical protein OUZ56_031334 [Daphnia magna]